MRKKKRKRNPKQIRIVIALILIIGIIYFIITMLKGNNSISLQPVWKEELNPTTNFVEEMSWTDNGIEITGTMKKNNSIFYLKVCPIGNKDCLGFSAETLKNNRFTGTIDLTSLKNGNYELWIESEHEEKLTDTRTMIEQIVRKKQNDKLITMDYTNDRVKLKIEDFKYDYDILIDPGHGGDDSGSYNKYINEEKLNLEQSLYEKKRYEEHGLKVKMMREDHSYGITMGKDNWIAVRKRAYALGYYGVVSRISYSNHHNSSEIKSYSGWEIIVPNKLAKEELQMEQKIASSWKEKYQTRDTHTRFYTRNSEDGGIYSKANDEVYHFIDYYAVIRIPYELFHEKNILYEGSYLSNLLDYDWYYTKKNWKKMSELKIKAYIESLGKTYIAPKS